MQCLQVQFFQHIFIMIFQNLLWQRLQGPIIVAERSKVCSVFSRSNAGIVCSNPTQVMDVYIVCVYFVFVLFCV
jgi:hypothetical protein